MNRYFSIIGVCLLFLLWALALVGVYEKGQHNKALIYAEIPPETIEFINNISEGLTDILISFNPDPDEDDWDNDNDAGMDPETGLAKIEDDFFVFYFVPELKNDIKDIQSLAHKAIPHLKDLCGRYYYPDDVKGRKLPIYISDDQEEFVRQIGLLLGKKPSGKDYSNTMGMYMSDLSQMGSVAKGILLNGEFFFRGLRPDPIKNTLWHEMTHYVFFTALDYGVSQSVPMWCYEGIAEYSGNEGKRPVFTDTAIEGMKSECDFTDLHFPYVYQNYTGGQSIFCYMEDEYKASGITRFLNTLYSEGVDASLQKNFSIGIDDFEMNWKNNLHRFSR